MSAPPRDEELHRLLIDVIGYIERFVVLTADQYISVALWIVHTHAIDAAYQTPYLNLRSAEKQSGKTRLLEILELLCPEAHLWTRPSEAVTYRTIATGKPTLLLDEIDTIWQDKGNEHEGLRALLNAGTRRGIMVPRCVGPTQQLVDFPTFCAKAIAGIGTPPDTVADRSLPIVMKRRTRDEPIERFRMRYEVVHAEELRDRLAAWAEANVDDLKYADPELPDELSDRAQDVVEPLLAIADKIGGEWSLGARQALVEVITNVPADATMPLKQRLLVDLKHAWRELGWPEVARSTELLMKLQEMADSPWLEVGKNGLTTNKMAELLRDYGIRPTQIKELNTKGYRRISFHEPWKRYVRDEDDPVSTEDTGRSKPGHESFRS